jgi:hypothetical protein
MSTTLDTTITCHECGEDHDTARWAASVAEVLRAMRECFHCHYWLDRIRKIAAGETRFVTIAGVGYAVGAEDERGFRGFDGARFRIRTANGRDITTTNLWCQGAIPPRFRERLPDNAEFIR